MNKILTKVPNTNAIDILNPRLWNYLVNDVSKNNTFCPDIKRVIYNIGTKSYPKTDPVTGRRLKDKDGNLIFKDPVKVLTTIVFFDDNTKVAVTNSEHDGVTFEEATKDVTKIDETGKKYTVKEGRGFEVATTSSKEIGLVYAIAKRMFGRPTEKGDIDGNGFGRILNDIVNSSHDMIIESHNRKEAEAEAKAKYEATKGTAKSKPKRESLAKTVDRLTSILDKLDSKLA